MIILDPGHGGTDSGAVSAGRKYLEKDLNLVMAGRIAAKLAGSVKVKLTREGDTTLDPAPRAKLVRGSGAHLCLSLHHNAFNGLARGAEVIHSIKSDGKLAKMIYANLVAAGIPGRRVFGKESDVKPGKDYYFMIRDTAPVETIIVEFGFVDNAEDLRLVTDPAMQDRMADAVARAVVEYLSPAATASVTLPVGGRVPTTVYYRDKTLLCFIEDGTTYAPVRSLAEMLGLYVEFDGKNVHIK